MSLTSVIRYVRALDSAATDGSGKTGLAFGDFTAKYLTQGGTLTSLTTETITTLGTYQAPTDAAHIRIKELNSADPTKGVYEVHFHNTQVAASGKKLWLFLSASGAALQPLELELIPYADGDSTMAGNITTVYNTDFATNYDATNHLHNTNVQRINGISASSVATVGVNIGTSQVMTFNANNFLKVSLNDILATTLTETSGQLAGGFKKFFNVATPASTMELLTAVATVNNRVTANSDQLAGQTVTAATGVTFPTTVASPTNITAGTITTVTNLTNAPANGDFTTTMKASLITQIWDSNISGHTTSGTFGGALNGAASAGDPWNTPIPGVYAPGTAGHILGTAIPDVAPGANGGLLKAGANALTTFASGSHFIGTVDVTTTVTNAVTAGVVSDKTGYALSSTGLDSVATTAPTGVASNFREMLVQVWRRFFKKADLNKNTGALRTYADNGVTVITTQTCTDDGTTQTEGAAT